MKKFIELLKKYKIEILVTLLFLFFFRSCIKSSQVKKLEKLKTTNSLVVDSLKLVIKNQNKVINEIPNTIRLEKIKVHAQYDDFISSKDRGPQLMELHMIVKNSIKHLIKQ